MFAVVLTTFLMADKPQLIMHTIPNCVWCERQKVVFPKVDMSAYDFKTQNGGASSYPTLVIMKNGKEVKRHVGYMNQAELKKFLE